MSKVLRKLDLKEVLEETFSATKFKIDTQGDWCNFVLEDLAQMKDQFDLYSVQLRKHFIDYHHGKINQFLQQYFKELKERCKGNNQTEPATISSQI